MALITLFVKRDSAVFWSGFISTCIFFLQSCKVFKHSCFLILSDKSRAPYFISQEINIIRTGYAMYYISVLFGYMRLQNRTLQWDFLVIFGELYGFLSCYNWYFYKALKYMHQNFQKVQFKSAYSNKTKKIYTKLLLLLLFSYIYRMTTKWIFITATCSYSLIWVSLLW